MAGLPRVHREPMAGLPRVHREPMSGFQRSDNEDLEKSETAKNTMSSWTDTKQFVVEVYEEVEKEAGSISQDQRFYADYLCGVKEFKPWMESAESTIKEPLAKPATLEDALALLENCKEFDSHCAEAKGKLEEAGKARESMEKASSTENEVAPLNTRWETVKKTALERVEKVQVLVKTWEDLKQTSQDLSVKMTDVPAQDNPNIEDLEKVFGSMKELFAKKKELLGTV